MLTALLGCAMQSVLQISPTPSAFSMAVAAGATLVRIGGTATVWAQAEVPESQAALLKPGTPVRATSTTPLQALFLLNDPLVHAQAQGFAGQLQAAAGDDRARVGLAFHQLLARPATAEESARAIEFLDAARTSLRSHGTPDERLETDAWAALARSMFRLTEFVYLD